MSALADDDAAIVFSGSAFSAAIDGAYTGSSAKWRTGIIEPKSAGSLSDVSTVVRSSRKWEGQLANGDGPRLNSNGSGVDGAGVLSGTKPARETVNPGRVSALAGISCAIDCGASSIGSGPSTGRAVILAMKSAVGPVEMPWAFAPGTGAAGVGWAPSPKSSES